MTSCYLCEGETAPRLVGRPDFEYGIAVRLEYRQCLSCGLVFASPMPNYDVIPSFYSSYSTHSKGPKSLLTKLSRRKALKESVVAIGSDKKSRILDYGCGNGEFLGELRKLGYLNVLGYDFDPQAVKAANSIGIAATCNLEEISGCFDTIMLNHVIEHLPDPIQELKKLSKLLSEGGLIVIRTPNNESLLAKICGNDWRGWETPRHLNVMNKCVLGKLVEKSDLDLHSCFNSKAMFFGMFHESLRRPFWSGRVGKFARHTLAFAAYPWGSGEESVAVARRRALQYK